jgi:hypothetical protein
MKASKIMIIRHGEKPSKQLYPRGVDQYGIKDSSSLIIKGWQRAGALAVLFAPPNGIVLNDKLATPQHLFAPGVGKHSNSKRSEQVISVLAEKIGVKINTKHLKGEEEKVAEKAMQCDGTVLIAWEHDNIHLIANVILGDESAPQAWPEKRFDVIFVFDYDEASEKYVFSQTTQMIMPGDKLTAI